MPPPPPPPTLPPPPSPTTQFRAISHELYGTEEGHADVRAIAVAHMADSPDDFQPFVTDEAWDAYLARMSRTSEWGDHLTLQAVRIRRVDRSGVRVCYSRPPTFHHGGCVSSAGFGRVLPSNQPHHELRVPRIHHHQSQIGWARRRSHMVR